MLTNLNIKKMFGYVEDGFVGLNIDNAMIILEPEEAVEFEAGRYLGFSAEVLDIQAFYKASSHAGVRFSGKPKAQAWGGVMTHIIDPSGNSFSVTQSS